MSDANDRLKAIQSVYLDALNHEPDDLAAAQTASDVTAVQANVARARAAYYAAVATVLAANSPDVEQAYAAVLSAGAAVQAARTGAAAVATLLGSLNRATDAATTLLDFASGE